jgi:hypothetical protein
LAVNTAMIVVRLAIEVGLAGAVAIVQSSGAQMTATIRQVMTDFQVAVNTGMINARRSITVGIAGMVAAANAGVGPMRAAGANMGQALADGLNSKVGAVQAAANRLAQAAAAATRAAAGIRSPSRVFMNLGDLMGQGLAVGLENSEPHLIKAARSITDTLTSEFAKVDTNLDLDPGLDKWATTLDSGVARSMAETSPAMETVSTGVQSAGPAVGTINVYNPREERASNSIALKMRELAEIGVMGRG